MSLTKFQRNQDGLGHVLLVILIVGVVAVVGVIGWLVLGKNKSVSNIVNQATNQAAAECNKEMDDKDLCKFMSSWEQSKQYRITSVTTTDGEKQTSTYEIDGDKTRIVMSGEYAYEAITIGDTTYTKAGDTWYKKTTNTDDTALTEDAKVDFEEPSTDETKDTTTYKSLGKDPCGSLTCFKYQVVDTKNTDTTEYIWFDDKDYKLRKTLSESKNGDTSESTFEYDNVSVSEPSPVKELAENQYIMPGSDEVMTIPSIQ